MSDPTPVPLAARMAVAALGAANAAPAIEAQALRAGLLAVALSFDEVTDEDRRRLQDTISRAARTTYEHGVPAR